MLAPQAFLTLFTGRDPAPTGQSNGRCVGSQVKGAKQKNDTVIFPNVVNKQRKVAFE